MWHKTNIHVYMHTHTHNTRTALRFIPIDIIHICKRKYLLISIHIGKKKKLTAAA